MIAFHLQRVLILLLGFSVSVSGQAGAGLAPLTKSPNATSQAPSLRLTAELNRQTYCRGDAELDSVGFVALFTFTNTGNERLILYKGSKVARVMVSRTAIDLAAGRFEINSSLAWISTPFNRNDFRGTVPNRYFVTLPPGTSYRTHVPIGFFAVRGDEREIGGAVFSGEHVLQVEVSTLPESTELAVELANRWRQSGLLWYQPITSVPVAVTVAKQRRVRNCP